MAIAPSATGTIYAAMADGHIFVTTNDGGSWTGIDRPTHAGTWGGCAPGGLAFCGHLSDKELR